MKFSVFQLSRIGGRKNNEDRMGYCYTREAALFLLADGMGGHDEGEVAAQITLQTMAAQLQAQAKPTVQDPAEFLTRALLHAHHEILHYAANKGLPDTPRTTLVAVLVQNGYATWAHCGDSRLYVVRDGELLMRTRDHSYMEQGEHLLLKKSAHINRNVLFTCLGSPARPIFDISEPLHLQQDDRLLLCSDGLWGNLKDEEIADALAHIEQPLEQVVPRLVDEALRRGGPNVDNTTAIVFSWDQPAHVESVVTDSDSITDDIFASTIQSLGWADSADSEVNDIDIEQSIAEINAAIQRTQPGRKS